MLKFEWDDAKAQSNLAKHGISFEESTNMDKDEIRTEYKREELGEGVRGKYYARLTKGTNLVLLDDRVAKAFPTAEDVNAALLGLLALVPKTRVTSRSSGRTKTRR